MTFRGDDSRHELYVFDSTHDLAERGWIVPDTKPEVLAGIEQTVDHWFGLLAKAAGVAEDPSDPDGTAVYGEVNVLITAVERSSGATPIEFQALVRKLREQVELAKAADEQVRQMRAAVKYAEGGLKSGYLMSTGTQQVIEDVVADLRRQHSQALIKAGAAMGDLGQTMKSLRTLVGTVSDPTTAGMLERIYKKVVNRLGGGPSPGSHRSGSSALSEPR